MFNVTLHEADDAESEFGASVPSGGLSVSC